MAETIRPFVVGADPSDEHYEIINRTIILPSDLYPANPDTAASEMQTWYVVIDLAGPFASQDEWFAYIEAAIAKGFGANRSSDNTCSDTSLVSFHLPCGLFRPGLAFALEVTGCLGDTDDILVAAAARLRRVKELLDRGLIRIGFPLVCVV